MLAEIDQRSKFSVKSWSRQFVKSLCDPIIFVFASVIACSIGKWSSLDWSHRFVVQLLIDSLASDTWLHNRKSFSNSTYQAMGNIHTGQSCFKAQKNHHHSPMFAQISKLSKRFSGNLPWDCLGREGIYMPIHANPLAPRWTDNSHGRFGGWKLVWVVATQIFFVHPENWGKIFTHFDGRVFFSNGLVQPPTRFCLDGFYFIGMFFLYKDLSRAPGLKLGGICLDDCWVNLNIWTVSPYFHTIRLIPHC